MMIEMTRNLALLVALSSVVACSSGNSPVDIGDARTGEKLADYAAHWQGYVEAYQFPDGSDKVRITLDASGNGTLEFGNSPALAPATDPDAFYPKSDDLLDLPSVGFAYSISMATVESARIHFLSNPIEYEQSWCALQTSYDWGVNASGQHYYTCAPPNTSAVMDHGTCVFLQDGQMVPDGTITQVGCPRVRMCIMDTCACDAQGCSAHVFPLSQQANGYTLLDAALDNGGESLVGTLKLNGKPNTVRLHRL